MNSHGPFHRSAITRQFSSTPFSWPPWPPCSPVAPVLPRGPRAPPPNPCPRETQGSVATTWARREGDPKGSQIRRRFQASWLLFRKRCGQPLMSLVPPRGRCWNCADSSPPCGAKARSELALLGDEATWETWKICGLQASLP